MGAVGGSFCLLALIQEVFLEESQAPVLDLLAHLQVSSQERPQHGDEVTVVVLEALCQPAALAVERLELEVERILLALEPRVEHQAVHDVVHHELQPLPDHHPRGARLGLGPEVVDHTLGLVFPRAARLLHHLVGEEGHCHDPAHPAPVLAVDREHHVLALAREDVEHHVPRPGAELHSLRVQHVLGYVGRRHHHQVALPHLQHEHIAVLLRHLGQVPVVQVISHLHQHNHPSHKISPQVAMTTPSS
jgi:hypothetical protein